MATTSTLQRASDAEATAPAPEMVDPRGPANGAIGSQLRFADLFAGIGGFHLALESIGARCVFACENDRHARTTYEANFAASDPDLFATDRFATDIRNVDPKCVPDFDLLCAGFPCQPFSVAGKRRGLADPRGSMFFEIVRFLEAKRPATFLLENVQGLKSQDGGRTFREMERVLTQECGYAVQHRVLRACDFGVPQLRPRLFIVGFTDPDVDFSWPEPIPLTTSMDDIFDGRRCHRRVGKTITTRCRGKLPGQPFAWESYVVDGEVRWLTPRQCLRMQGFPEVFHLPVSTPQAYRQVGNSVAVPVAKAVASQIATSLGFAVRNIEHTSTTEPRCDRPSRRDRMRQHARPSSLPVRRHE